MANEQKFTGLAAQYARYRPGYPAACLDWLMAENGLAAGDSVADVGAGTGIFTALLLGRGLRVCAVEPNADMRGELEATLAGAPNLTVMAAGAEDTGLASQSVKLVTTAQAFHWFDAPRFAAECRRILAPGGRVAILWNTRDSASPVTRGYDDLRQRLCPAYKGSGIGLAMDWVPGTLTPGNAAFFRDGVVEIKTFPNDIVYDEDGFVGHALSASYAPKAGAPERRPFIDGLHAFYARHAQNGRLVMPNFTEVYLGEV